MNKNLKKLLILLVVAGLFLAGRLDFGSTPELPAAPVQVVQSVTEQEATEAAPPEEARTVTEDGFYTSCEEVALYIHQFGHLPGNYITKQEAQKLGWVSSEGNLGKVAPGKSIGGDRFGNYEGTLPEKDGRQYRECDIDFDGTYRGAKRIVFSNDGLVYYTEDHYKTFTLLYGEE